MPTFECPTCRSVLKVARNEEVPFRPFCSERCKLIDLGKWFDGSYTISEPIKQGDLPEGDPDDNAP